MEKVLQFFQVFKKRNSFFLFFFPKLRKKRIIIQKTNKIENEALNRLKPEF